MQLKYKLNRICFLSGIFLETTAYLIDDQLKVAFDIKCDMKVFETQGFVIYLYIRYVLED